MRGAVKPAAHPPGTEHRKTQKRYIVDCEVRRQKKKMS